MLEKLTSQDFSPLVGEVFMAGASPSESIEAELIEVAEIGNDETVAPDRRRPFSLVFRMPPETRHDQRIS